MTTPTEDEVERDLYREHLEEAIALLDDALEEIGRHADPRNTLPDRIRCFIAKAPTELGGGLIDR